MKRAYQFQDMSDDESTESSVEYNFGDEDEDEDEDEDDEQETSEAYYDRPRVAHAAIADIWRQDRDDRPWLLTGTNTSQGPDASTAPFQYQPTKMHANPFLSNNLTHLSPHGVTWSTLEYNLRHAIEVRDDKRMAVCLTEMFRHFVYLNRPMWRLVYAHPLDRQTRMDLRLNIGSFSNPVSFGVHQRLLTILLGIFVRQIGVATPTALQYLVDEWKMYERALFHHPAKALSKLLGIGTTLSHCKKDATVAYSRHLFEDTSKMREWRNEVLKRPDIVATYISNAQDAQKARRILLCNKIYFDNRMRLRRYQLVCIGTPHPEYMCQGGCMARGNVLKLVDAFKTPNVGTDAIIVMQYVEDTMVWLASHVNNVWDRDYFEALQVDFQLYLYYFHAAVATSPPGPDSLLETSKAWVRSAPNIVKDDYVLRLWNEAPNVKDFIHYGIVGEPVMKKQGRGKKKALGIQDLADIESRPELVPKMYESMPPSVLRDEDNIVRQCPVSATQSHPCLHSLHYIFGLYRLSYIWKKCLTSMTVAPTTTKVVLDREFIDATQPYRVLYQQGDVGALEVHLHGHAARELIMDTSQASDENRMEKISTEDFAEAEIVKDYLCGDDTTAATARRSSVRAVVVGPWSVQEMSRLEREVANYQHMKETLGVHPDKAFVKKMILLDLTTMSGCTSEKHVLGRIYAWVVYIPSLGTKNNQVLMTIDELKTLSHKDPSLDKAAKAILRPLKFIRTISIMKRTCHENCNWKIGDNYVSFCVDTDNCDLVLSNIRIHTIAETLLDLYPDHRFTKTPGTLTKDILEKVVDKCMASSQYAGASVEMAKCDETLGQV